MEPVRAIAAQQSGESGAVQLHSGKRVSEVRRVNELLVQMAAAWPAQEQHEETAVMYQFACEELAAEFGLEALQTALRRLLTRTQFFPHPAEIRMEIERMSTMDRAQWLRENPYVRCGNCTREGLVRVWKDGVMVGMRDCECKLAWRAQRDVAYGPEGEGG